MNDRINRFSVVFSSNTALIACILFCANTAWGLINWLEMPSLGIISVFLNLWMIFVMAPLVVISVGLILMYVAGRKDEVHPAGIVCMKVGIIMQTVYHVLAGLVAIAISLLSMAMADEVSPIFMMDGYTRNDSMAAVKIVFGLIVIGAIAYIVVTAMYGIKLFSMLGTIRWYEQRQKPLKTGFINIMTIGLVIWQTLSAVATLGSNSMLWEMEEEINEAVSQIAGRNIGLNLFDTSNQMMSILFKIAMVVFYILLISLLGKMKYIDQVARGAQDNVQQWSEPQNSMQQWSEPQQQNNAQQWNEAQPQSVPDIHEVDTYIVENDNEGSNPTGELNREASAAFARSGKISCVSGYQAGSVYEIRDGEEIVIGVNPNVANIVVDSMYTAVSRKHCAVRYIAETNEYFVIDYSTNGTYMNGGTKLNKNYYVAVPAGTVIQLGAQEVAYRLGE